MTILHCAGRTLDLSEPKVMGILNVTPDSFSDGGRFTTRSAALEHARTLVSEGAAIIDVGGESTRPGAPSVSTQEELDRVIPVIEAVHAELPVPISVDTSKAEVMREAVAVGAGLINDVRALRDPAALAAAVRLDVPVCLMHMQGEPRTMQRAPHYADVVTEVKAFLRQRMETCLAAGLSATNILIDPGFGFGKTLEHNLALLRHLGSFAALGRPVLVGMSRKSMIGQVLDNAPVGRRSAGSLAAAVIAVMQGAAVVRAHEVRETVAALAVCRAVMG